jgi:hypothetical protein
MAYRKYVIPTAWTNHDCSKRRPVQTWKQLQTGLLHLVYPLDTVVAGFGGGRRQTILAVKTYSAYVFHVFTIIYILE